MAFNWKTFWTRAFTALIFVAVMMAGLLYNEWSFLLLISCIHFGCWWEYLKLNEKIFGTVFHPYLKLGFCLAGFHLLLLCCGALQLFGYSLASSFSLPFLLAGVVLLITGIFQQRIHLKALGAAALGLIYISLSWALLLRLRYTADINIMEDGAREAASGFFIPVLLIVAIWINDTCAYLVGSMIGKTPFSKISPKKTMEGTIGGMLLCVAAITFILQYWFHWQVLLGISLIAAIAGTAGDLLESKLKRMAGVKDSGSIMPGHGGFMDRFDSLLVAIPFVWLFLQFFR
ncbi:phosphatidate cytidylyltransferase [Niabella drilacis]|uniref:Phosphatidate cytidylyltransferase n=1 Tax=Niabella drilacis (strain DSM 25811 / CCM 8410 / CCUG 62505 / LMG 26954 / E90) TaxID=1285928 RepID=A0A1G6VU99_NIADE|nr:phosphatidate cytidylyltransferase [Niabella drilacis]SDD57149.1 phosphatidate cytidylyltransferase [Niabella drilacis]